MARGLSASALEERPRLAEGPERRAELRVPPSMADFHDHGIVRPGRHDVRVLNLARGGVLVECSVRLRPGTHAELQMIRGGVRVLLRASISRCRVMNLGPLVYEAALRFDQPLRLPEELLRDGCRE
jgi:hypothetical protein